MSRPCVRAPENPILSPDDLAPSRADLEVLGVFNPAVLELAGETALILRVAEAPRGIGEGEVAAPIWDPQAGLVVRRWRRDRPGIDASDPRVIRVDGESFLTSISHLRVARSRDGLRFAVDPEPLLAPAHPVEAYGIEDPRVATIDGQIALTYTAVSGHGIATALALGPDLASLERRGIVFPPPNRNVAIFPERIGGRFVALHRPMTEGLGRPSIWLASSPDLLDWGEHRFVAGPRPGAWDDEKIGGGAVPIRIRHAGRDAWLAIYHGVTSSPFAYSLGALVLDAADPARVLGRSRAPILAAEAAYERSGFLGGVVFTCGAILRGEVVRIYYGAADGVTAVADLSLAAILESLR
jgi:beta-1,2-mannobiose phosphorylase / 1,2-beta-oligomannan phosphorylase